MNDAGIITCPVNNSSVSLHGLEDVVFFVMCCCVYHFAGVNV